MPTPVYNVYKAKDRVTDRNGTVWQYNALYGTFRAHYDATGKALATYSDAITYSAEALEKQLGPLKRVVSKPRFVGRFEVTVNRGIEQPTVAGVFTALTTRNHYSDGYFGTDDKVTVKELPVERRSGVIDRRSDTSDKAWRASARARISKCPYGRRAGDKERWEGVPWE
jgi:hypothetical protein